MSVRKNKEKLSPHVSCEGESKVRWGSDTCQEENREKLKRSLGFEPKM